MSISEAANLGAGPVKAGHRFDEDRLGRWMAKHIPAFPVLAELARRSMERIR